MPPPIEWGVDGDASPFIPSPTVPVHNNRTGSEDIVLFLGRLVWLKTHWVGKTLPHSPENCRYCKDGFDIKKVYYAPALIESVEEKDSRLCLRPVVFTIPSHRSRMRFGAGPSRGELYRVWRKTSGSVDTMRSERVGPVLDLPDSLIEFDVRAILMAVWFPSPETRRGASAAVAGLPAAYDLPRTVLRSPPVRPAEEKLTPEQRAEAKKALEAYKQNGFTSQPAAPTGRVVTLPEKSAEPKPDPFANYEERRAEAMARKKAGLPPRDAEEAILFDRIADYILPNGVPGKPKGGAA